VENFFGLANQLYRRQNFFEAALIYEYLCGERPWFRYYKESRDQCMSILQSMFGEKCPELRSKGQTVDGFKIAVYDAIVRNSNEISEELRLGIEILAARNPDAFLLLSNYFRGKDEGKWLDYANKCLISHGMQGIEFGCANENVLHRVNGRGGKNIHGELVTIFMSAYNAESTIKYAVRSILAQDYKDIEVIIYDDNSTDGTADVVDLLTHKDPRVRFLKNKKNEGTYRNRNSGLSIASGKYFTVMDADDFCHPQRIPLQIKSLTQNPDAIASLGSWLRVTPDGMFIYRKGWGGGFTHEAVATMLFDRQQVTSRIGYYDNVRFGADTEYLFRMRRVFGKDAVVKLKLPLELALYHEGSLTGNSVSGVSLISGLSNVRIEYQDSWKKWHKNSDELFVPLNQSRRQFSAPKEMI
jgi:hypothetical protein